MYCIVFTYLSMIKSYSVYSSCSPLNKLFIWVQLCCVHDGTVEGTFPKPCYISRTSPDTSRQTIKGLDEALALQPVWGANTCTQPWQGGGDDTEPVFDVGDVQTSCSSPSLNLVFVTRKRLWTSAAAAGLVHRQINKMWGCRLLGTVLNYPAGNPK